MGWLTSYPQLCSARGPNLGEEGKYSYSMVLSRIWHSENLERNCFHLCVFNFCVIALNSLFGVWAGGQNFMFSVPSTELVLRSIGGREGEKGKGKGSGLRLSPRTSCVLHQPHLHSLLSHPQGHYPENGHRHLYSTGLL